MGDTIHINYDDDPNNTYLMNAKDARYLVDRGLLRFTPPPKERRMRLGPDDVVCKFPGCGAKGKARKKCPPEHKGPGAPKPETWGQPTEESQDRALTPSPPADKMTSSNRQGAPPPTTEEQDMGSTAEKLSAKAAAIEIGTDARTLRKFLRSDASTFEACGQGNRYEFTKGQLKKLKKEFDAWGGGKATSKKSKEPIAQEPDDDIVDDADLIDEDIEVEAGEEVTEEDSDEDEAELDDLEPDDDDLVDLDDLEIDDED